ncbi:hypothetical protein CMI37_08575 [Candidatus Pacearchaeota archaeon]|nr:hypothetical protein [Candidatus Pacearchaeota archaeon]
MSSIVSLVVALSLYWKWKKDDEEKFDLLCLVILIFTSTVCIFIFLPVYIIENRLQDRVNRSYQEVKETLQNEKD